MSKRASSDWLAETQASEREGQRQELRNIAASRRHEKDMHRKYPGSSVEYYRGPNDPAQPHLFTVRGKETRAVKSKVGPFNYTKHTDVIAQGVVPKKYYK